MSLADSRAGMSLDSRYQDFVSRPLVVRRVNSTRHAVCGMSYVNGNAVDDRFWIAVYDSGHSITEFSLRSVFLLF